MGAHDYAASILVEARRGRERSVKDIADQLGVSRPAVTAWEQGKAVPHETRFDEIERAYGLEAGLLAALYSDPKVSLGFWFGRAYQIERHLKRVWEEQAEYVRDMQLQMSDGSGDDSRETYLGAHEAAATQSGGAPRRQREKGG